MGARLQSHIAMGAFEELFVFDFSQSRGFRMRRSISGMKAAGQKASLLIQDDTARRRVGRDPAKAFLRLAERQRHGLPRGKLLAESRLFWRMAQSDSPACFFELFPKGGAEKG